MCHIAEAYHEIKNKELKLGDENAHVGISDISTVPAKYAHEKAEIFQPLNSDESREPLLLSLPSVHSSFIDYNDPSYYDPKTSDWANDADLEKLGMGEDVIACPYGEAGDFYINYLKFRESARMALLKIRELKPHLFREPMPLVETEILHSALYRSILAGKEGSAISDQYPPGEALSIRDPRNLIEMQQDKTEIVESSPETDIGLEQKNDRLFDFLRRVRDSHTAVNRRARRKVFVTSTMIRETDYLPPPAENGEIQILPPRKRALKPMPAFRAPPAIQINKYEALVQIVSARNIPQRISDKEIADAFRQNSPKKRSSDDNATDNPDVPNPAVIEDPVIDPLMLADDVLADRNGVKCFVESRLQENFSRTTPVDGVSPMWRQSMAIAFKMPNGDLSVQAASKIDDDLIITLFDEVVEDDAHRGGFLEGENTSRTERRYLGEIRMPMRTVINEGRVEGYFRVDAPLLNFGYTMRFQGGTFNQQHNRGMFLRQDDQGEVTKNLLAVNRKSSTWYFIPDFLKDLWFSPPQSLESLNDSDEFLSESMLKEFGVFTSGNAATYISVMVTLDPLLTLKPAIRSVDKLPPAQYIAKSPDGKGNEFALIAHARRWLTDISSIGPHTMRRNYVLFATDHTGYSVFIPRYLSATMNRPEGFSSRRSLVHLVSQLPFIPDAQAFIGETDLWCTVKQTLDIGAGDEEEHAVLLYNLLANKKASQREVQESNSNYPSDDDIKKEELFLILGAAMPEGDTVYLLMRDISKSDTGSSPSNFVVINPCSGYIFSAADPNCPLKRIFSLITPYNIFANIQVSDVPCHMDFNVLNSSNWRPFYGKRFPFPENGLFGIQSNIEFFVTSSAYCLEIESTVKNAFKSNVRKWRSKRKRSITTFHPDASATMYDALQVMESWRRNGNVTKHLAFSLNY